MMSPAVELINWYSYPCGPCILSILPNNNAGHYKKATTVALQLALSNCGYVICYRTSRPSLHSHRMPPAASSRPSHMTPRKLQRISRDTASRWHLSAWPGLLCFATCESAPIPSALFLRRGSNCVLSQDVLRVGEQSPGGGP